MKMSIIVACKGIYARCSDCNKLVRINKPILGAVHFCLSEEELEAKQRMRRRAADRRASLEFARIMDQLMGKY